MESADPSSPSTSHDSTDKLPPPWSADELEDDTAPLVRVSAAPVEKVARAHREFPPLPAAARARARPALSASPPSPERHEPGPRAARAHDLASAVPGTFALPTIGAGMLRARRSRAPLVVFLVLATIATIAVVCLVV
jgi:hypothetical protein